MKDFKESMHTSINLDSANGIMNKEFWFVLFLDKKYRNPVLIDVYNFMNQGVENKINDDLL